MDLDSGSVTCGNGREGERLERWKMAGGVDLDSRSEAARMTGRWDKSGKDDEGEQGERNTKKTGLSMDLDSRSSACGNDGRGRRPGFPLKCMRERRRGVTCGNDGEGGK